jgi:hypothetical protein
MQRLCIALLVFTALLAPAQQPASSNPASSGKLSIPAQLTKTVRADKARAGDRVEFRTLEPVLVCQGLVMPANTLLHGRVLVASSKQDGKNSRLALVVERAEWKQHSLPLHAFVVAQISISPTNNQRAADPGLARDTPSKQGQIGRHPIPSKLTKLPQDATTPDQGELAPKYPTLENVGILRDKDGTVYLLSSKSNVKLPAGVLLMLKNEPVGISETADAKTVTSASATGRQN